MASSIGRAAAYIRKDITMVAKTFSPDPATLDVGPGTAAQQTARPRMVADHANGGWDPMASGATAGTPGTFTPAGCATPADRAALAGVTASPASTWATGQFVRTRDGQDSYWASPGGWTAGHAPVVGGTDTERRHGRGRAAEDD